MRPFVVLVDSLREHNLALVFLYRVASRRIRPACWHCPSAIKPRTETSPDISGHVDSHLLASR